MRELTSEQRGKERSIAIALVIDILAEVMIVSFAITTGSLTLVSEAVRSVLIVIVFCYSFHVLRSVHRGQLTHFEFGVAKLENLSSAFLGICLLFSGFWIAHNIIDTVFAARIAAGPFDLAVAAVVNAVNVLLNTVNWLVVRTTPGSQQSEVYKSQLHGRFVMMTSSLFLQLTLTAAALARDPMIALFLDALGAAFVTFIMLRGGLSLLSRTLPTLLDARAPAATRRLLEQSVKKEFYPETILSLRTRRCGDVLVAEAGIAANSLTRPSDLRRRSAAVERALGDAGHPLELTIVPLRVDREELRGSDTLTAAVIAGGSRVPGVPV